MDGFYGRFLDSLPPERQAQARSQMRMLRARRGQVLLGRGASSTDIYFIREGAFSVVAYSPQGREVSLRTLSAGDVVGELAAVDGQTRSATVVAETDARVDILSREDFLALIETSPKTAMWLAQLLASKIRDMNDRIFELSALNVQARLHCELLRLAKSGHDPSAPLIITPAPTHEQLANRIGTHREAVTRELGVLKQNKVIVTRRGSMEVVDLRRLEHFVGQAVGDLI